MNPHIPVEHEVIWVLSAVLPLLLLAALGVLILQAVRRSQRASCTRAALFASAEDVAALQPRLVDPRDGAAEFDQPGRYRVDVWTQTAPGTGYSHDRAYDIDADSVLAVAQWAREEGRRSAPALVEVHSRVELGGENPGIATVMLHAEEIERAG